MPHLDLPHSLRSVVAAAALAALLLAAAPSRAQLKTFFWDETGEGEYAVRYRSRTIMGDYENMLILLQGNTGRLCLDEGFAHARMESIELSEDNEGLRDGVPQVLTTVELFRDEQPDSVPCSTLAELPAKPKELERSGRRYEIPLFHSIQVEVEDDPFEENTVFRGSWSRIALDLDGSVISGTPQLEMAPRAVSDGELTSYSVLVQYLGKEWMFIREGESLVFRADGETLRLRRTAYDSKILDLEAGVFDRENAVFAISRDDLMTLATAEEVLVRLDGKRFDIDRKLSLMHRNNFRRFVDQVEGHLGIRKEPAPAPPEG